MTAHSAATVNFNYNTIALNDTSRNDLNVISDWNGNVISHKELKQYFKRMSENVSISILIMFFDLDLIKLLHSLVFQLWFKETFKNYSSRN